MQTQRQSASPPKAATNPANPLASTRASHAEQPLNRSRALRVLGTLAVAAAGAAALTAERPEEASATTGTLNYTSADGFATIQAYDTGSGDAIFGSSAGSNGLEGSTAVGYTSVNGPAGVVGWTNAAGGVGVIGQVNASGLGIWGQSNGGDGSFGVYGKCSNGTGVEGSGKTGVSGIGNNYGVVGSGSTYGVFGGGSSSGGGTGVFGQDYGGGIGVSGNSYGGIGISGTTNSPAGGAPAVQGVNSGGGPGVVGYTPTGTGVGGGTATGIGFAGIASSTGIGVAGQASSGYSGFFFGGAGVLVNGNFTQMNGAKSAAVRGADGKLKRLYSLESPESWFEDFGSGQLSGGTAAIQFEPGFAGVVHGDNCRVFLTPRGESKGWLFIGKQSPNGFTVQEAGGGTSNIAFDYRIVAKRKDIAGARLEQVEEPPVIDLSKLAEPPATPPPPPRPSIPSAPTPPGHGH